MLDIGMMAVLLVGGHAVGDFACQSEFMAKAKSRSSQLPNHPWQLVMLAHVAMHGAIVAVITGIWWLALCEGAIHFITDDVKCQHKISFRQDQAIHYACKAAWLSVAVLLRS